MSHQEKSRKKISIHALLAESDHFPCTELYQQRYFYPRSPCGERPCITIITICTALKFLSTLSLRRATGFFFCLFVLDNNFYPRSPCGERPLLSLPSRAVWIISIHALLAESDRSTHNTSMYACISIHALLAESDLFFLPTG